MRKKSIYFLQFVLVFMLFYLSSLFQLIPIYMFGIRNATPSINVLLSTFSAAILVIILYFIYREDLKKEWKIFEKDKSGIMNTTFNCWFVGLIIMLISNALIIYLTGSKGANNEILVQKMIKAMPIFMFIDAGLLAPFNEELIFRKAVRKFIDTKWLYVIMSGLIFGALHIVGTYHTPTDILFIIPYGVLGSMFALAYYKTKTIYSTIFMHMIHNSVLVGISILVNVIL